MNLDELTEVWRSHDLSPLYGVDKTLLHQALRQEQAKRKKEQRWAMRVGYGGSAVLLITSALFLAIMLQPNDDHAPIVWDYVVGLAGLAAAVVVVSALLALRRSEREREQRFGDSLRDHLRRRIAQIDDEATRERRLGLIVLVGGLICAVAISVVSDRIKHVPVPYSEMDWPSPFWGVVILGLVCAELFRWAPRRWERKYLPRKRQLEALLKELDDE